MLMSENVAYARGGFRWQAALEWHPDTKRASVLIGKTLPPRLDEPDPVGQRATLRLTVGPEVAIRIATFVSDRFAPLDSFAREVYGSSVDVCAGKGYDYLDMEIPGQATRTIRLMTAVDMSSIPANVEQDPNIAARVRCIALKDGWYPFPSVPQRRDSRYAASPRSRYEVVPRRRIG